MAVLLALLSMACAGANDLLFKGRMRAGASAELHLLLVATVWTIGFLVPALAAGAWSMATLIWGLVSGAFGIAANILLLAAMRDGEVGACATVYRLNLVPAMLLAALVFDEALGPLQLLALCAAVSAVVALGGGALTGRGLLLAGLACLLRAGMALGYKQGILLGAPPSQLLLLNGLTWLGVTLVWAASRRRAQAFRPRVDGAWGLLSGLLVCGNVLFLTLALTQGPVGQVVPISQLSFIATMIAGCACFGEVFTRRKLVATGLAACCILLLGQP